ncbi:hypothetical protein ABZ348_03810 [Streptomyces sp. NPDC005963]|uniref:hypothetical protein n=1 Tax=Streptomyces sp. NPDC005963 TaxID=3156721 RepID=UPI0033C15674
MNKFKRPARNDKPSNEAIRYRPSRMQIAVPATVGILLATALLYVGLLFTDDPMPMSQIRNGVLLAAIAGAVCCVLPRPRGVQATSSALIVGRGPRGKIPWGDVASIQVGRTIWGRRLVVIRKNGNQFALSSPMSMLDKQFDEKAAQLLGYWESRRKRKR